MQACSQAAGHAFETLVANRSIELQVVGIYMLLLLGYMLHRTVFVTPVTKAQHTVYNRAAGLVMVTATVMGLLLACGQT